MMSPKRYNTNWKIVNALLLTAIFLYPFVIIFCIVSPLPNLLKILTVFIDSIIFLLLVYSWLKFTTDKVYSPVNDVPLFNIKIMCWLHKYVPAFMRYFYCKAYGKNMYQVLSFYKEHRERIPLSLSIHYIMTLNDWSERKALFFFDLCVFCKFLKPVNIHEDVQST